MDPTPRRRLGTGMAIFAIVLSVASLFVELSTGMCAQTFFDPLPDSFAVAAYAFLALVMAVNERVLGLADWRILERTRQTALGLPLAPARRLPLELAFVSSGLALAIAVTFTLQFLPILPVSAVAVIIWGLGLCGWSPVFNLLVVFAQMRALANRWELLGLGSPLRSQWSAGCACAAGLMLLVGRPLIVGYHLQAALLNPGHREQAVQSLRWLGAENDVLRLCYQNQSPWMQGWGRSLWTGRRENDSGLWEQPSSADTTQEARKLYYLMTGHPFETADASRMTRTRMWTRFDDPAVNQQGGELVGRAVRGLTLASSRIDGVLDPRTETAYAEWTLIFRNANTMPEEARAELLLPEGAVVDKVSLWINGEERPAAFGPREVVRQAYQEVAVVQQRDPLLVTAKDTGHVLAQCFPVPAQGEMKIRLGMTAPLMWEQGAGPRLTYRLPSFQHVNFGLPAESEHQVWLEGHWDESRGRLDANSAAAWELSESPAPAGKPENERTRTARLRQPVSSLLGGTSLAIAGGTAPTPGDTLGDGLVRRTSPFPRATRPLDLLFLVSPTLDMRNKVTRAHRQALAEALTDLPAGSAVRFVDVREAMLPGKRKGTVWLEPSRLKEADGWWDTRRYDGGAEPAAALQWAWDQALTRSNPAAVVWLHGPTPAEFKQAEQLLADYERRPEGPVLVGLLFGSGPDALMRELGGNRRIFARCDGDEPGSLAQAVRLAAAALDPASPDPGEGVPLGGREPALNGVYVAGTPKAAVKGASTRTERLAAFSHVLAPWYAGKRQGKEIEQAQKLAIGRRLVTPMSGAVVLETKEQYDRYNLSDSASPASIPSVPEPGTVAMLAVAAVIAGIAAVRRRKQACAGT